MPQLGTIFEVGEVPQSAGASSTTGTLFFVGAAAYGPEEPTRVRSLSEVARYYGERETENAKLYDALNAFFALGGQTAYVNRIHGAGSPVAAGIELETASKTKVITLEARFTGKYGEKYAAEVIENAGKTAAKLVIYAPSGEVVETSPEYTEAKLLKAWIEEHKTYVKCKAGANYASGEAEVPKVLAKKLLTTISGVNPTNSEATTISSLEGFAKTLGPGQIVCSSTESRKEKVHQAIHETAQKNNRFGLCDIEGAETAGTSAATLKTNKKAGVTATALLGYGAYFSSDVKASGVTIGTERTIPSSAVVAGLMARVAQTGTDNLAPAGPRWPLSPFVLSFVNTYNETQMNELNESGINCMAERQGRLCLYGDVTACPQEKDLIFYQYTASRERMRLVYEGEGILEEFQFVTLDGRHQKRAMMQGRLQGMCKRQWELNAIYGETAPEAAEVKVGEPVNTPATEQAGELNAEILAHLSPTVWSLRGILISIPITEAV